MIIIKSDINSIFPITINKIIKIFDDVNSFEKSISSKPYKSEFTVFVIVSIESLKEFSKFSPPIVKILDKKKILIKKQIKTKKEEFKLSLLILYSVFKILWSITVLGEASLYTSTTNDLSFYFLSEDYTASSNTTHSNG